jgi:hypothetical protein
MAYMERKLVGYGQNYIIKNKQEAENVSAARAARAAPRAAPRAACAANRLGSGA